MASEAMSQLRPPLHAVIGGESLRFADAESKFTTLATAWDEDNLGMSTSNYRHAAHLQIIGMGATAIPMLLDRLRKGERRWAYALACITGEHPEKAEMRGNAEEVIKAWLEWGAINGWGNGGIR